MGDVATAADFARTARRLADEARRLGLDVPGFRSPPGLTGTDRSLRRRHGFPPAVAVRVRERRLEVVVADMVEGVVVANDLEGSVADGVRRTLLGALAA